MKTQDEVRAIVEALNVIDDTLFHKIVEDRKACQEMIRVFTGDDRLCLIRVEAQRYLRNTGTHSVILDALGEDRNGTLYGIEMQKPDNDDHQKRVRYVSSNLDTNTTEKGTKFTDIPDMYMIYLSDFDLFRRGKTVYHVERTLQETGDIVYNGYQEIYINTVVDDGSRVAELMQYMKHTKGSNKHFPHLSARVRYLKKQQEGVREMCRLVEEYAEKRAKETEKMTEKAVAARTARRFLENGASYELVRSSVEGLTENELQKIRQEVMTESVL